MGGSQKKIAVARIKLATLDRLESTLQTTKAQIKKYRYFDKMIEQWQHPRAVVFKWLAELVAMIGTIRATTKLSLKRTDSL